MVEFFLMLYIVGKITFDTNIFLVAIGILVTVVIAMIGAIVRLSFKQGVLVEKVDNLESSLQDIRDDIKLLFDAERRRYARSWPYLSRREDHSTDH